MLEPESEFCFPFVLPNRIAVRNYNYNQSSFPHFVNICRGATAMAVRMSAANFMHILFIIISCSLFFVATGQHNHVRITFIGSAKQSRTKDISFDFTSSSKHFKVNCADGDVNRCNVLRAVRGEYGVENNCTEKKYDTTEKPISLPVDKRAEDDVKGAQGMDVDQDSLQQLQRANGDNDRLSDLLDLNSEPAVEDLMRQIMSQAKLWEAIQEANREMVIQKDVRAATTKESFPLAFNAQ